MMTPQGLQIVSSEDSFAWLRIVTDGIVMVNIVFGVGIAGGRRLPVFIQRFAYLFLLHDHLPSALFHFRLLNARERERIPLPRIRPCMFDRKARIIQQAAERFPCEFAAALGMDRFEGRESKAKFRSRDIHELVARAFQVHLNTWLHAIPAGPVPEAAGIKVGAEFSVEAMQNVQIERRGGAIAIVIRPHQRGLVFYQDSMQRSRGGAGLPDLARGPGRLTEAMQIDFTQDGLDLCAAGQLWLATSRRERGDIGKSVRTGLTRNADLKLRFYERGNPYVSGPRRLRQ
jgi:hypothetical protein